MQRRGAARHHGTRPRDLSRATHTVKALSTVRARQLECSIQYSSMLYATDDRTPRTDGMASAAPIAGNLENTSGQHTRFGPPGRWPMLYQASGGRARVCYLGSGRGFIVLCVGGWGAKYGGGWHGHGSKFIPSSAREIICILRSESPPLAAPGSPHRTDPSGRQRSSSRSTGSVRACVCLLLRSLSLSLSFPLLCPFVFKSWNISGPVCRLPGRPCPFASPCPRLRPLRPCQPVLTSTSPPRLPLSLLQ